MATKSFNTLLCSYRQYNIPWGQVKPLHICEYILQYICGVKRYIKVKNLAYADCCLYDFSNRDRELQHIFIYE